ncbi:Bacterial alpha-L-rhamnosidase [Mucilaginibacter corticis]|uniref:Bacterial alpha-L-rhamnosidase n=1 Tax=Mucilaginibacter corticis TaxID=2597670 RepID=A0A556MTQ9_9SPHI|nr:alpha-L-rhamnosidase C-terminal domain-containing protein [Mucilaginibacter corticis]TSJ43245.1 Bacterial alpha-L-rhamnosidase [Mucilaginibacter corticis]
MKINFLRFLCFAIFTSFILARPFILQAQVNKYPPVSGHATGATVALSPDPIVRMRWANTTAADGLESYPLRPVKWTVSDPRSFNMQQFKSKNSIEVTGKGEIRFDFGQINAGWLEFDSDDLTDSVTMSISEYNEPAIVNTGAVHPVKTLPPVKYGHTYRLELSPDLYEGVRFGWIHVLSHQKKWHIKNLRLVCQIKPVNYNGSFSCSDPELTKIWYTGAYTVKLNLQKDYFGAILMERSDRFSWTGDAYPSQAASMVAFGNYDFVKKNLVNTSKLDNGIASYALYWVLSVIDYVNYTGDITFLKGYTDNAAQKLDNAYKNFDNPNNLGFYGWDERLGAGFENPTNPETRHAYTMLAIRAWLEFGNLLKQTDDEKLADKYLQYTQTKMDEERKKGTWLNDFGLHASADAINTTLTTAQENTTFYKQNYTDRVNRISYSPFNNYFIIGALGKMDKYDDAISAIKDCWGGQINYGGTTFFEVYRPSWNQILGKNDAPVNNQCGYTSLTHPWSAGVVKWLSEELLGIKPTSPGFKTFQIVPHLSGGLTSVKGATPTLSGNISADFNELSGISTITIPQGTVAEKVAIPTGKNAVDKISLNGVIVWSNNAATGNRSFTQHIENGYIVFEHLKPGKYNFKVTYKSAFKRSIAKQLPWKYVINQFKQDSLTGGKWTGKYGTEGYMLFNYFKAGKHLQKLPAYVDSVVLTRGKNVYADLPAANSTLTDTAGLNKPLGAIATQDPMACLQTMTMDLHASDNSVHQMALYFLDWDNKQRRSAIEIFDLKTKNLLAPVQLVKNYTGGKYVIFNYSGSIRIRINQVRGENAAVSGIFFK